MDGDLFTILGGIGLFLFGMHTMTDALRLAAGRRTREVLARFTRTPLSGAIAGTLTTAVIQSSSATTVTVVGFVGAGLMTFPQAVGVIFGANIGTTFTGWMVAVLGFKLQLGTAALPLLFVASLARVLSRGAAARLAEVLAGFSMIFVGLTMMQAGMTGLEGWITPARLPGDSLGGRVLLVLIGAALTAVTQSSSAGVATALVLLGSGAISFTQAAALVIGMDVGTTVTALMATFGGSRAMRQTGVAHVAYNVLTGAMAFAILGLVAPLVHDRLAGGDDEIALVTFHTLFNLIGVVVMLPFARPFARLVEWMVPERPGPLTEMLDRRLLADPGAATDAARAAARAIAAELFAALGAALAPEAAPERPAEAAARTEPALVALRDYLAKIVVPEDQAAALRRYAALLHQFDHLHRLQHRCLQTDRIAPALADPGMRRPALLFGGLLRRLAADPAGAARFEARLSWLDSGIDARLTTMRHQMMARGAHGGAAAAHVFELTDAMRWLKRSTAHVLSIVHYDRLAQAENPPEVRPGGPGARD